MDARKAEELRGLGRLPLPCACANLRRAARSITQFYDQALRAGGFRVTQFTLLQALTLAPGISQKQLSELLQVDSTTLTRTLALLRRANWLRSISGKDRREIRLFLTPAGRAAYRRAVPFWRSAQNQLRKALGEKNWLRTMETAALVVQAMPRSERLLP